MRPLPYEDDPQVYGSEDVKLMVAFQKVYPPELLRLLPQECQSLKRGRERSFEEIRARAYLSGQCMYLMLSYAISDVYLCLKDIFLAEYVTKFLF